MGESESTGFKWFNTLILLFVLAFIFIVVLYAWTEYIKPAGDSFISSNTYLNAGNISESLAQGTKAAAFLNVMPVVMVLILLVGLIILAIYNQKSEAFE